MYILDVRGSEVSRFPLSNHYTHIGSIERTKILVNLGSEFISSGVESADYSRNSLVLCF